MLTIRLRGFIKVSVLPHESHVYGGARLAGWGGEAVEAAMQLLHNQPTKLIQADTMANQLG